MDLFGNDAGNYDEYDPFTAQLLKQQQPPAGVPVPKNQAAVVPNKSPWDNAPAPAAGNGPYNGENIMKAAQPPPAGNFFKPGVPISDPSNAAALKSGYDANTGLNANTKGLWDQAGGNPQQFVSSFIAQNALKGTQTDPTSINSIVNALQGMGINATLDQRNDQYHKGIMLNGKFVKLLDGNNNWIWQEGGDQSAPDAAGGPGGFSAFGAFTPSGAPPSAGSSLFTASTSADPRSKALFDMLMKRAQQSEVVDPNDPIIKGQTDAFNAQQQRAERNYLSGVAERAGPNANIGSETRHANEVIGQSTSAFEAQLMGQELTARRQEIMSALSGAEGMLTSEEQMALQEELAKLSLAQQQFQFTQGQGQQESQFERTLANNAYQFDINDQFRNSPLGS